MSEKADAIPTVRPPFDVQSYAAEAMRRARLETSAVPVLKRKLTDAGIIADPKTGYILGFVDGVLSLGTIIEASGLPELEALEIFGRALDQEVIVLRGRS